MVEQGRRVTAKHKVGRRLSLLGGVLQHLTARLGQLLGRTPVTEGYPGAGRDKEATEGQALARHAQDRYLQPRVIPARFHKTTHAFGQCACQRSVRAAAASTAAA